MMLSKMRPRFLVAARGYEVQSSRQSLISRRRLASTPREEHPPGVLGGDGRTRSWQQQAGGGGEGGWQQGNNYRRSSRRFRDAVPLSWLCVSCISVVDLVSNAYVVETEDFGRLIQRCNFHIAAVAAGESVDLSSLYDLLDWVYESVDAVGPSALPKLLDADLIDFALRGTQSPDPNVSSLCHEMLNVLSSNEHVAAMMAKNPTLRDSILGEVRRQLFGWKSPWAYDEEAELFAPDQTHDLTSQEGQDVTSTSLSSPPRRAIHHIRSSGTGGFNSGVEGIDNLDEGHERPSSPSLATAEGEDGGDTLDRVWNGKESSDNREDGALDRVESDDSLDGVPETTIVLDPFYAALTLRTLCNVMRASRTVAGTPESPADAFESSVSRGWGKKLDLPWPLRDLYGRNDYGDSDGDDHSRDAAEWPVEQKLAGDIAELMLSIGTQSSEEAVSVIPYGGHQELGEIGQMEIRQALQGLEMASAAFLRESSCHPELVRHLMRKMPLLSLVTVSWRGQSVKAEDWSAEATMNICDAYRRMHSLPAPRGKMSPPEVVSLLNRWSKRLMAEEREGTPAEEELGANYEDQSFVLQAERAVPPLALSDPLLTVTASAVVGLSGIVWGAIRRWVAWRLAGETFSAVTAFALPRALMWAGLRAGLGATALTATHGPFGFRSQMRYRTLDTTRGRRGTLAMSGVREIADLGYLYVVLRLCPYSLLPAFVLNAMLRGDAVGADAW